MVRLTLLIVTLAVGMVCLEGGLTNVKASDADFSISGPEQSIEEFTHEWRRLRKYTRSCGVEKNYQATIAIMEGSLGASKYNQQKKIGKKLKENAQKYMLGYNDDINVTKRGCRKVIKEIAPIVDAFYDKFIRRETIPLYRAPEVP